MSKTPVTRIDDASILDAVRRAKEANEAYLRAFRARFTPGARVSWVYGSRNEIQHGRVVTQGVGDRLEVCNDVGGAQYWIHGYRVTEAMRK